MEVFYTNIKVNYYLFIYLPILYQLHQPLYYSPLFLFLPQHLLLIEMKVLKFLLKYLPLLHVPYSLRKSLLKYSTCLRKLFKVRLQMKFKMLIHPNLLDFKLYLMLMLTNLIRIMRMTTLKEKV
jgi:hypothetical protein